MFKLKGYLKPFALMLLIAIGLLFLQAQMDLALPDYLSKIVNVGIQQNGIEDEIPSILTEDDYMKMKLFLFDEAETSLENSYTLMSTNEFDLEGSYYILNDLSNKKLDAIKQELMPAFIMTTNINMQMASGEDIEFNDQIIPSGTDIFKIFEMMPEEELIELLIMMQKETDSISPELSSQMGIGMINSYYKSLDIDVGKLQNKYILKIGVFMILITIVGAASSIAVGYFASKIAAGVSKNLRKDVFSRVLSFSNAEFDKFSTASLITRSTNDITQVQTILAMMIRMVFYAPLMGIGGVFKALDKSVSMSWIIAVAVIILLILIITVFIIALPRFKKIQKLVDKINLVIREHLNGMLVIRAFNTQKFEEKRFNNTNEELTQLNLFVNRVMALLFPAMMFIMNGVMILIIWVGANEIAAANLQVGDMMAFMQYAIQIIMAFLMLSMMFIMIPRASVSAARIAEVLETDITIIDPKEPMTFKKSEKGMVVFDQVSFKYPGADEDMLQNLSFTAKPGEMTAIIGSTGAGKTTLVNLINRFYDVTAGSLIVNGANVKEVTQKELRSQIGYVPQKSFLFSGSIGSNLKYGKDNATLENLEEAITIAQGKEFVENAEDFNKLVAQSGQNFSGGQKQRISIARALIKKPEIYIFDDSFSALDFKTDSVLRKALKETTADKTMIVVAQRVSTIMNADQIIVLDDGKMVGKGTHKELLKSCETYLEIASTQLTKEEL